MSELVAPTPGSPAISPSRPGPGRGPLSSPGAEKDGAAVDPDVLPAQLLRASEHLRAGRLPEAGAAVNAVLRQAPHDLRALNLLGLFHFRSGQLTQARAIYLRLLNEHPRDTALRLNVGLIELRRGEAAAAAHHLRHVVDSEPDNLRALGYYGLALLRTGDLLGARQVLLRAGQPELLAQVDQLLAQPAAVPPDAPPSWLPELRAALPIIDPDELAVGAAATHGLGIPIATDDLAVTATATRGPLPLGDFLRQKELVIPAGRGPLALTADGLLVVQIREPLLLRTTGTLASSGDLRFSPPAEAGGARSQGSDALLVASGIGTVVLGPRDGIFTALTVPADHLPLRIRETALFAAAAPQLPTRQPLGAGGADFPDEEAALLALHGPGSCVLWSAGPLRALRVQPEKACFVDSTSFVGAYGELVLTVGGHGDPGGTGYLECSGAGFVLIAAARGYLASGSEPLGVG